MISATKIKIVNKKDYNQFIFAMQFDIKISKT